MNITAIKISQAQNVLEMAQAVKFQNQKQQDVSKLLTQAQSLNIAAMASAIKEAQDVPNVPEAPEVQNTPLNFSGSVEELLKYVMCRALAGEINIDEEPYNKMVKTNDGKTYQVEVRKPNEDEKLLLGDNDAITVEARRKDENGQNSSKNVNPLTVGICPEAVAKAKQELAQLKQKYGEI